MPRVSTFPSALNRKKDEWQRRTRELAEQIRDFRKAAHSLVTLNIEPNTCKVCPHKYSCVQNAVYKGLFRSFAAGFLFKAMLSFLSATLSGKLGRKGRTLEAIFWSKDSLRFGQFIGVMSFIFKAVLCALRRYFKRNDPKFHALAGFAAGSAIVLDNPRRRANVALYCLVRALADLYMNLKATNKIRSIPYGGVLTFALAQAPIIWATIKCPSLLDKGYHNWILKMGNLKEENVRLTTRSRISDSLHRLPGEKWQPCQYHPYRPSCTVHAIEDWFFGLLRAGRIYLPVHLLPTILFSPLKIVKDPLHFLKAKSKNIVRSAIFLTTYQATAKGVICLIRNTIKDDPNFASIFAGLSSGLSVLVEHPRRRSELTLYVLPRALEVCFNYVAKFHG